MERKSGQTMRARAARRGWVVRHAFLWAALSALWIPPAPPALAQKTPESARGLFSVVVEAEDVDLYGPAREEAAQRVVGELLFVGGIRLIGHDERFGGFSGLVLDEAGRTLLAVSDRGYWLRAELRRDKAGVIRGLRHAVMGRIRDIKGEPVTPAGADAEALAIAHGRLGRKLIVAFEHWHRLWSYPLSEEGPAFVLALTAPAQPLRLPRPVRTHPPNRGLEAVVEIAPGRLLAFSEGAAAPEAPGALRAWLIAQQDGTAQPLAYLPGEEGFAPTDAALWRGCCVIVLERRYRLLEGAAARLVAVPLAAIRPAAELSGRLLARLQPPMTVDNFEGLWVEPGADGRPRLILLSDDNYSSAQQTLLMTFAWPSGPRRSD